MRNIIYILILITVEVKADNDSCFVTLKDAANDNPGVQPVLTKHESGALLVIGFGGLSVILALIYNTLRKRFYKGENSVDTTFDAGGNVTLSLTAVTVASQFFWPGDILYSATLTAQYGLAGPFWYGVGILVGIFLFPVLSINFKTRAPGAKTYLQIMKVRFGTNTHIVFCFFALLTNLVVVAGLVIAAQSAIQSLTKDASNEFIVLVMAALCGSYSLIGGLGTTFYVSYLNACLVFLIMAVLVIRVFFNEEDGFRYLDSIDKTYEKLSCLRGPENNYEGSFLTFRSGISVLYGVLVMFAAAPIIFCDQASWQSRLAAKPKQGLLGYILAALVWFAIPTTMSLTTGIKYLDLSYRNGSHLLNTGQLYSGLVTPLVAERVLGLSGGIMILIMSSMALMSTGSGEIMAISSIIVYDVYQTYIKPFRKFFKVGQCILCGKPKNNVLISLHTKEDGKIIDYCACLNVQKCGDCKKDVKFGPQGNEQQAKSYRCLTHGLYRRYQDNLITFKSWCILWVIIFTIPFGLLVLMTGIDLHWIYYVGCQISIPSFPPVMMSIMWSRATGKGLISGAISGLIVGIIANLSCASTYEGGLSNFLVNTAQDYTMLAGAGSAILTSFLISIIVSYMTFKNSASKGDNTEWIKTHLIDNVLYPWELQYSEELKDINFIDKPSFAQVEQVFLFEKKLAYILSIVGILVALILPVLMLVVPIFDRSLFKGWVIFWQIYALFFAIIVILMPPIEEVVKIRRHYFKTNERKLFISDSLTSDDLEMRIY